MSKITIGWLKACVSLLGVALTLVQPVVGVVVSTIGTFITTFHVLSFNSSATRMALSVAALGGGASIFLATKSPLLGAAPPVMALGWMANEVVLSRWRALFDFQAVLSLAAGLILLALAWPTGWWGMALAPYIAFTLIPIAIYLTGRESERSAMNGVSLRTGQAMPEMRLPYREKEGEFVLSEFRGQHVLLVFIRGDWCPVCHVMVRIIAGQKQALAKHNVKLVLITPTTAPIDGQFRKHIGLDAEMLVDAKAAFAQSLQLLDGGTKERDGAPVPLPVALFIDPSGALKSISRPDDVTAFSSNKKLEQLLSAA